MATVENWPLGTKIIQRYNYTFKPDIPNTSRYEVDETGKISKKQIIVSQRKRKIKIEQEIPLLIQIKNTDEETNI